MPEYGLDFSERLIFAGHAVQMDDGQSVDAQRTVLYLSMLSIEICLKALLEKAGMPMKTIVKRRHDLSGLLRDLGGCHISIQLGGAGRWVPASRIRSVVVDKRYVNSTIGAILESETRGASKYPCQIRYGNSLLHVPAPMMLKTAEKALEWARKFWDTIRL